MSDLLIGPVEAPASAVGEQLPSAPEAEIPRDPSLPTFRFVGKIAGILLALVVILTAWNLNQPRRAGGIKITIKKEVPDAGSRGKIDPGQTEARSAEQPEGKGVRIDSINYPLSVKAGENFIPISCKVSRGAGIGKIFMLPLVILLDKNAKEIREKSGESPVDLDVGQQKDGIVINFPVDGIATGSYFLAVIPTDPETGKKIGKGIHRQGVEISGRE